MSTKRGVAVLSVVASTWLVWGCATESVAPPLGSQSEAIGTVLRNGATATTVVNAPPTAPPRATCYQSKDCPADQACVAQACEDITWTEAPPKTGPNAPSPPMPNALCSDNLPPFKDKTVECTYKDRFVAVAETAAPHCVEANSGRGDVHYAFLLWASAVCKFAPGELTRAPLGPPATCLGNDNPNDYKGGCPEKADPNATTKKVDTELLKIWNYDPNSPQSRKDAMNACDAALLDPSINVPAITRCQEFEARGETQTQRFVTGLCCIDGKGQPLAAAPDRIAEMPAPE